MVTDSPTSDFRDWARRTFIDVAAKCEGARAIFLEDPDVTLVRVSDITSDEWGVKAKVSCMPTPGMSLLGKGQSMSCDLGAAWRVFSSDATEWYAHYVNWKLFFDTRLIEKITEVAAESAMSGKLLAYDAAMSCVREHRATTEEDLPLSPRMQGILARAKERARAR